RATDSGSVGRGFKSLRARYLVDCQIIVRVAKLYIITTHCHTVCMAELFFFYRVINQFQY
ncbi:MAG: hypothetical protein ACYTX0_59055, partial [Nostoc sp.]